MNNLTEKMTNRMFETKAIKVCPKDHPFWYTSGTIGPYYVNTHFLYGNEQKAVDLLKKIDEVRSDILNCPKILLEDEIENYESDKIYRGVIDDICSFIKENIGEENFDCISGGERRDWFFSLITAKLLKKPHITIYKNLATVIGDFKTGGDAGANTDITGEITEIKELKNKRVLHIVDLVTEASSYERAWIPAIKNLGSEIVYSLTVVDRKQGGDKVFENAGIKAFSMIDIDMGLFDIALANGLIDKDQHAMIGAFMKDPRNSMRDFLMNHPDFLEKSLEAGGKTAERARLCIEKNIYGLKG